MIETAQNLLVKGDYFPSLPQMGPTKFFFYFQMHIEAAKMLSFSEEEFVKALEWGS